MNNTKPIPGAQQPSWPKSLDWSQRGRANAVIMIDDRITNLIENQWVNWFINSLIHLPTCYNFDKHALISKDAVNART